MESEWGITSLTNRTQKLHSDLSLQLMTVRNSFDAISDAHLIEHNWLQSKSANNRTSYYIHEVRSDTVECYHELAVQKPVCVAVTE